MSTHSTTAEGPKSCTLFRKWLVCWHHGWRSLPCTCRWPQICRLWAFQTSRLKQREVFTGPLTKCSRQSCVLRGIYKLIQQTDFSNVCQEKSANRIPSKCLGGKWPPFMFSVTRTTLLLFQNCSSSSYQEEEEWMNEVRPWDPWSYGW